MPYFYHTVKSAHMKQMEYNTLCLSYFEECSHETCSTQNAHFRGEKNQEVE